MYKNNNMGCEYDEIPFTYNKFRLHVYVPQHRE